MKKKKYPAVWDPVKSSLLFTGAESILCLLSVRVCVCASVCGLAWLAVGLSVCVWLVFRLCQMLVQCNVCTWRWVQVQCWPRSPISLLHRVILSFVFGSPCLICYCLLCCFISALIELDLVRTTLEFAQKYILSFFNIERDKDFALKQSTVLR